MNGPASWERSDPGPAPPSVEVRPSKRRTRTVQARWEGDQIVVDVPARLSVAERWRWADELSAKLIAQRASSPASGDAALAARAHALSQEHFAGTAVPASVAWSTRQQRRWGSCTPSERTIRISARLKAAPGWVLDAVLVHELAHLLEVNHNARFRELVSRYPRTADAAIFLEGYGLGLDRAPSPDDPPPPDASDAACPDIDEPPPPPRRRTPAAEPAATPPLRLFPDT